MFAITIFAILTIAAGLEITFLHVLEETVLK